MRHAEQTRQFGGDDDYYSADNRGEIITKTAEHYHAEYHNRQHEVKRLNCDRAVICRPDRARDTGEKRAD